MTDDPTRTTAGIEDRLRNYAESAPLVQRPLITGHDRPRSRFGQMAAVVGVLAVAAVVGYAAGEIGRLTTDPSSVGSSVPAASSPSATAGDSGGVPTASPSVVPTADATPHPTSDGPVMDLAEWRATLEEEGLTCETQENPGSSDIAAGTYLDCDAAVEPGSIRVLSQFSPGGVLLRLHATLLPPDDDETVVPDSVRDDALSKVLSIRYEGFDRDDSGSELRAFLRDPACYGVNCTTQSGRGTFHLQTGVRGAFGITLELEP